MIQRLRAAIARVLAVVVTVLSLGQLEVQSDGTLGRRQAEKAPIETVAGPEDEA